MRQISGVLERVEGVQIFYIVGLLIFVSLFVVIVVRTMRKSKAEMDEIKNYVLDDSK